MIDQCPRLKYRENHVPEFFVPYIPNESYKKCVTAKLDYHETFGLVRLTVNCYSEFINVSDKNGHIIKNTL